LCYVADIPAFIHGARGSNHDDSRGLGCGTQPPLQNFYETLQEEQKARVIVKYIIARGEIGLFDTTSAIRTRPASPAEPQKGSAPAPRVWSCEQLEARLRAWPIMKIEQAVQLWPRQYSAFYELAASVHHAADRQKPRFVEVM
jgi:hypothetical protein